MAKDTEVIVETIKQVTKMIDVGNENAILSLAIQGASQAKLLADFRQGYQTGQTKNSIQWITGTGKEGGLNDGTGKNAEDKLVEPLKKNEAAVGATTAHAPYVELGTRKQAPQPFIRPALAIIAGDAPRLVALKTEVEFKLGALGKYGKTRVKF